MVSLNSSTDQWDYLPLMRSSIEMNYKQTDDETKQQFQNQLNLNDKMIRKGAGTALDTSTDCDQIMIVIDRDLREPSESDSGKNCPGTDEVELRQPIKHDISNRAATKRSIKKCAAVLGTGTLVLTAFIVLLYSLYYKNSDAEKNGDVKETLNRTAYEDSEITPEDALFRNISFPRYVFSSLRDANKDMFMRDVTLQNTDFSLLKDRSGCYQNSTNQQICLSLEQNEEL